LNLWNPYAEPARDLDTKLSPAECRVRLGRRVAPWYEFWPTDERPLKGRVVADSFALYRFRRYRHGFESEARGRLELSAAGTRLRVRFGFKLQDRMFTVLWVAIMAAVAALLASLPLHGPPSERWFPLGFVVAINLFMVVIYPIVRWLNRDDVPFLMRLIEGELQATPVPGGGPLE